MAFDSDERISELWSNGSEDRLPRTYLGMAAELVDATDVDPDDTVLDIGCGTGSVAITAARRGATVTGLDINSAILDQAEDNAETAGVGDITWREGRATDLPFEPDHFDVVLSSLGHIYADSATEASAELLRVARPGARIGFTAWTPSGLYPVLTGLVLTYTPRNERPEYEDPPFMWGDPEIVEQRLGGRVTDLGTDRLILMRPTLSPNHFWDELTANSGLFGRLVERVDDREGLRKDAAKTISSYFDDTANAVELESLQVSGTVGVRD